MYVHAASCTNKQHFLQIGDSLLVDITPFRAADYGMPPLNQVWCVMTIIPRQSILNATDAAIEPSSDVSLVAVFFFVDLPSCCFLFPCS